MRVVFAGTPEFSVPSLNALIDAEIIDVVGVFTQPDRPAGRGKKSTAGPIKVLAEKHELPVFQPLSFRETAVVEELKNLNVDLLVVTAYGLLLPQAVLDIPALGCINVHASLLPRWRGAAPIQRAIEFGDTRTGVTLMQMALALDSGPILAIQETEITADETGRSLHDKLSQLGGELLSTKLPDILDKALEAIPQDSQGVTFAKKLEKKESAISWQIDAMTLERKIRAFNPWPVCTINLGGRVLRVLRASYVAGNSGGEPGQVMRADKNGIRIQTADGQLNLEIIQKPGGKALTAAEFLNGMPITQGSVLSSE